MGDRAMTTASRVMSHSRWNGGWDGAGPLIILSLLCANSGIVDLHRSVHSCRSVRGNVVPSPIITSGVRSGHYRVICDSN